MIKKTILLGSLAAFLMSGCITKTGTGALLGGAVGALAGQAIGGDTTSTLIGAGVGAAVGGAAGNQEDAKDKRR
jgi:hypothetical protein